MSLRDALDEVGMTVGEFVVGVMAVVLALAAVIALAVGVRSLATAAVDAQASKTFYAVTFKHDDHLFVKTRGGYGLLHHPGCPCQKAEK